MAQQLYLCGVSASVPVVVDVGDALAVGCGVGAFHEESVVLGQQAGKRFSSRADVYLEVAEHDQFVKFDPGKNRDPAFDSRRQP
jgi:hypothetical protein